MKNPRAVKGSRRGKRATAPGPARVYRGQSNAERREGRRERLVAAALELFGTVGYAATPIDVICTTAGVTARHFYEHFASREALLRTVYDGIIADAQHAVLRGLAQAGDPEGRTAGGVKAFVRSYLQDPRKGRIACVEVIGVSEDLERHRRSVIHAFASVIQAQAEALAAEGRLQGRQNFELAGIAMAGAVNELMADWLFRRDKPPIDRFARDIVAFFLAVMKGGTA